MKIVDGVQHYGQNLTGNEQMPQIGTRVIPAGVAAAMLVKRRRISSETSVLDV